MTRRIEFRIAFLASVFGALLLPAAPAFTQAPPLPPEILNRPLLPCSSPPGVDSNVNGVLWPGGRVPYVFDANVSAAQQTAMLGAMKEWENVSPVRFVPRTSEADYLHIKNDPANVQRTTYRLLSAVAPQAPADRSLYVVRSTP
ncbi:MAG: hypothetical protein JXQ29_02600 [Planctomycetes bacterium]|nr:hypothetical protein [Planctomycetota bacterium]